MSEDHSEAAPVAYYHGGEGRVPNAETPFRVGILAGIVAFFVLWAFAVLSLGIDPVVASILAAGLASGVSALLTRWFARQEASRRFHAGEEYRREQNAEVEARIAEARENGSFQRWENQ